MPLESGALILWRENLLPFRAREVYDFTMEESKILLKKFFFTVIKVSKGDMQ